VKSKAFLVLTISLLVGLNVLGVPAANAQVASRPQLERTIQDLNQEVQHLWNQVQNGALDPDRNESDMRLYMAISNLANTTRIYTRRMDTSSDASLTAGARRIVRLAERVDRMMDQTRATGHLPDDWADVQFRVSELADAYNIRYSGTRELARSEYYRDDYRGDNYFRWQGTVDGSDMIRLQGNRVTIQHINWQPIRNPSFDLRSPLPRAQVPISMNKLQGRGRVQLVESPSARNGYTAVVLIEDLQEGADFYSFELRW
jgi:hypothetical protein